MQTDESRQRVLVAVKANLTAAKCTVAAAREKARYSDEPHEQMETRAVRGIFAAAKIRSPDLLEHETLDIKGGAVAILGKNKGRTTKEQF